MGGGSGNLLLTVTEEKLSESIEGCDGISTRFTYNYTWQEIYDAFVAGQLIVVVTEDSDTAYQDIVTEIAKYDLTTNHYRIFNFDSADASTGTRCTR